MRGSRISPDALKEKANISSVLYKGRAGGNLDLRMTNHKCKWRTSRRSTVYTHSYHVGRSPLDEPSDGHMTTMDKMADTKTLISTSLLLTITNVHFTYIQRAADLPIKHKVGAGNSAIVNNDVVASELVPVPDVN